MKNYRYVKWAWQQPIEPAMRKLVLLAVAYLADNEGVCIASRRRIMKATGASMRSVIDHIAALEESGDLVKLSRRKQNGKQAVNAYYLASGPKYYEALYEKERLEESLKERESVLS